MVGMVCGDGNYERCQRRGGGGGGFAESPEKKRSVI